MGAIQFITDRAMDSYMVPIVFLSLPQELPASAFRTLILLCSFSWTMLGLC